ncbi:MAG: hypothetical protein K0Q50_872 [Vampirovibrio sp.]|nr:hypothetical protein [Vampirovibrio sp.]
MNLHSKSFRPKRAMKKRSKLALAGLAALLAVGGLWVYSTVSELGPAGLIPGQHFTSDVPSVRLKEQPVYKVKKKQEVLGVQVVRIISKQQPEEFLVVDGVSRKLVDQVYGKKPDLVWANLMANQLMKLRQPGDGGDTSPISVEIQNVKTLNAGVINKNKQALPYWQLEVRFKLSNEDAPRYYQAGVVRNARSEDQPDGRDTLVVGYAQKEAFQKELVADLMNHLSFEQN